MTALPPPNSVRSLRPYLLASGSWLVMAAVASIVFWHLRGNELHSQSRELTLLSLAFTDGIDRGLRETAAGLREVRAELLDGRLPVSGPDAERALRIRGDLLPWVRTLWLTDSRGRLLSASDRTPLPEWSTFAPPPDRQAGEGISVSRPFEDRDARETLIALALRVDGTPAATDGWILAGLPAARLLGAFASDSLAADLRLAVYRGDGVRLAAANPGALVLDETSGTQPAAGPTRVLVRRLGDGSDNLVASRTVPGYDIKVMLARDLGVALSGWRQVAELTAVFFALLFCFMVTATHLVVRANRRRLESQAALHTQLSRAGRLEALGTLAGGVAHDFNNVLASIIGFGEMAQDAARPGSDQARQLRKLLQAALRGRALVERIVAFSRGGSRNPTVFELEPVIEEALALLAASPRAGVSLVRSLDAPGGRVRGDPTQAFEAVMNLCTNATQAMPTGGRLTVRLARLQATTPRVLSHSLLPAGRYLALTVADEGEGIRPEVMERLFEPFFTTRGAQAGSGLGLAVVHGVVAEFGGAIDVQSTPGHGARFTLYFPESTDTVGVPIAAPLEEPRGSGQELLVVDDEPELVALSVELLIGLGYAPVGFSSPVAALDAVREQPQRFAALVTDEVMPGLSGTELTKHVRVHAPDLPVLLVSGYGGALLGARAAAVGVTRVLAKPLQRAELALALAGLLH